MVNDLFFLVDLPGFGFARVSAKVRHSWRELVEGYLIAEPKLRGVVHLVDARHDPTATDLEMVEFLAAKGLPTLVDDVLRRFTFFFDISISFFEEIAKFRALMAWTR